MRVAAFCREFQNSYRNCELGGSWSEDSTGTADVPSARSGQTSMAKCGPEARGPGEVFNLEDGEAFVSILYTDGFWPCVALFFDLGRRPDARESPMESAFPAI